MGMVDMWAGATVCPGDAACSCCPIALMPRSTSCASAQRPRKICCPSSSFVPRLCSPARQCVGRGLASRPIASAWHPQ